MPPACSALTVLPGSVPGHSSMLTGIVGIGCPPSPGMPESPPRMEPLLLPLLPPELDPLLLPPSFFPSKLDDDELPHAMAMAASVTGARHDAIRLMVPSEGRSMPRHLWSSK